MHRLNRIRQTICESPAMLCRPVSTIQSTQDGFHGVQTVNHVQYHRVHTEWQLLLSGVHSIMMEKLAQAGESAGVRPPPFTISTISFKVVVYAPAERAEALPLFLLYPYMYSVFSTVKNILHGQQRFFPREQLSPTD
jgi:hypothetical protein